MMIPILTFAPAGLSTIAVWSQPAAPITSARKRVNEFLPMHTARA
jgi:hypothetical protein